MVVKIIKELYKFVFESSKAQNSTDKRTSIIIKTIETVSLIDPTYIDSELRECISQLIGLYDKQDFWFYSIVKLFDASMEKKDIKTAQTILLSFVAHTFTRNKDIILNNNGYSYMQDRITGEEDIHSLFSDDFLIRLLELVEQLTIRDNYKLDKKEFLLDISIHNNYNLSVRVDASEKNTSFVIKNTPFIQNELFKKNIYKHLEKLNIGKDLSNDIVETLFYLYFGPLWNKYNFLILDSFFNEKDNDYSDAYDNIIKMIAKQLLLKAQKMTVSRFKDIYISKLNNFKEDIFKRILLYIYGSSFSSYREDLFIYLRENAGLLFANSYYEAELHGVLEKNVLNLNATERKEIEDIIIGGHITHTTRVINVIRDILKKSGIQL
ncbi:hypothetical protein AAIR98_000012 [Elusimicrobium simillimum]|uniref:hypothetical protein n=1 Tax=Elusimicrobium simillimum TaxID=3143438 RepID=UPI003C6EA90F